MVVAVHVEVEVEVEAGVVEVEVDAEEAEPGAVEVGAEKKTDEVWAVVEAEEEVGQEEEGKKRGIRRIFFYHKPPF